MNLRGFIVAALAAALPVNAQPQAWAWDDGTVPYVQTPMEIVERMLRMAEVKAGDHLINLGSGDGRIVIEAAKRGATGTGVDLDWYTLRERDYDEVLPWDHVNVKKGREYLEKEQQRSVVQLQVMANAK